MALRADHVQATGLAHLAVLLLDHQVVFALDPGDELAQLLDLGVVGGGLFGRLGNAILQFQHGEGAVAPGRHQVVGQLGEGMLGGIAEGAGVEGANGPGLSGGLERGRLGRRAKAAAAGGAPLQGHGRAMALLGAHQPGQQHLAQLQAPHVVAVAAKNNIGATAGHVGGNRDGPGPASLGNDFRFPLHIFGLGVEQVVGDFLFGQQGG